MIVCSRVVNGGGSHPPDHARSFCQIFMMFQIQHSLQVYNFSFPRTPFQNRHPLPVFWNGWNRLGEKTMQINDDGQPDWYCCFDPHPSPRITCPCGKRFCPLKILCYSVDGRGYALFGRPSPPTFQLNFTCCGKLHEKLLGEHFGLLCVSEYLCSLHATRIAHILICLCGKRFGKFWWGQLWQPLGGV